MTTPTGFKHRGAKKILSESEIEQKTAAFADKADAVNAEETASPKKAKNAKRETRFTVRVNDYELQQLEALSEATGLNKVMVIRQAIRDYAARVIPD